MHKKDKKTYEQLAQQDKRRYEKELDIIKQKRKFILDNGDKQEEMNMEQKLSECLEGLDKSGSFEDISTLEEKQSEEVEFFDDYEEVDDDEVDFIDVEDEEGENPDYCPQDSQ
jgi:hypothetical protein